MQLTSPPPEEKPKKPHRPRVKKSRYSGIALGYQQRCALAILLAGEVCRPYNQQYDRSNTLLEEKIWTKLESISPKTNKGRPRI